MKYQKQVALYTVSNVLYLMSQWLLTVITTRLAGITQVGMLTVAISVTSIIYAIQSYGVRPYQVSDVVPEFMAEQYVFSRKITILIGLLLCIGYVCLSDYTVKKATILLLFVLFRTAECFSDVYFGELQKNEKLDIVAKSMWIKSFLSIVLFTFFTWIEKDIVLALCVITIVAFAITLFYDRVQYYRYVKKEKKVYSFFIMTQPIKKCLPMMIASLFPIIITSLPRMILDQYYGTEIIGYYGNVSTPTALIVAIVPNITTPLMTLYGRWIREGAYRKLTSVYLCSLGGVCVLYCVCIVGIRVLGEVVMELVYTAEILPFVHFLYPLVAITTLYAFTMCNSAVLISMRCNTIVWVSAAIASLVCVVSSLITIEYMGINGVIVTMGVSYGIQNIIQWIVLLVKWKCVRRMEN